MKTIFTDPVMWAEKAVGTPTRFRLILLFQTVVGCGVVYSSLKTGNALAGFFAILVAVVYPLAYIYTLRQLLSSLKKEATP